jgi:nucleotide-binding universal stress UspA family protein
MTTKILVPLDGSKLSERALEQAEIFAKALGAEVILTRAIENPLAIAPEAGPAAEKKVAGETINQANSYLNGVVSSLKGKGIKGRAIVKEGPPSSAILGVAQKEDVNFIVMSTHGHTGLSKVVLGSVAEKVVYATSRPVILVKPERIHEERVDEVAAIMSMHG